MAQTRSKLSLALASFMIGLLALQASAQSAIITAAPACPTITKSGYSPTCTKIPICPQPDCILLSSIANPCHCPTAVPTSIATYADCGCHGACGTSYETITAPCASTTAAASSTVTSKPTIVCPTVTIHANRPGFACPDICVASDKRQVVSKFPPICGATQTIGVPCGCKTLPTVTACPTCGPICATAYVAELAACPTKIVTVKN